MRLADSPVRVPGAARCPLCASLWGRSGDTRLAVTLRFIPFARQLLGADCAQAPGFVSHILQKLAVGGPVWGAQRLVRGRRALVLPLTSEPASSRDGHMVIKRDPGFWPLPVCWMRCCSSTRLPASGYSVRPSAMEPSARVEPRSHCPCRRPRPRVGHTCLACWAPRPGGRAGHIIQGHLLSALNKVTRLCLVRPLLPLLLSPNWCFHSCLPTHTHTHRPQCRGTGT